MSVILKKFSVLFRRISGIPTVLQRNTPHQWHQHWCPPLEYQYISPPINNWPVRRQWCWWSFLTRQGLDKLTTRWASTCQLLEVLFKVYTKKTLNSWLVGGFNPFEKNRQIGSFPQVWLKMKNMWNHHPVTCPFNSWQSHLKSSHWQNWAFFTTVSGGLSPPKPPKGSVGAPQNFDLRIPRFKDHNAMTTITLQLECGYDSKWIATKRH